MNKKNYIIPVFVPHIGCNNDCVFCNQRKITGQESTINIDDIIENIRKSRETIPEKAKNIEIAFYGGSFTGIDLDIQEKLLKIAYDYKEKGKVDKIRLSTRPDYIDAPRLDTLEKYNVDIIELGVQSISDKVLKKSKRGHNKDDVIRSVDKIKERGFTLGIQVMPGLPGDNKETFYNTIREVIKLKPDIVRIYPTLVIKDTELEEMYLKGEYEPISMEESIQLSKRALIEFERANIDVIRIGLQPSDNIREGKDLIAGPFHPSYRQLVEGEIYYDILEKFFENLQKYIKEDDEIYIFINSKNISNLSGQNRVNRNRISKKIKNKNIKIISKDLDLNKIIIRHNERNYEIDKKKILNEIYRTI